jgi:sorting nexin-4
MHLFNLEYITGDRFSAEFVDKRRASLQRFLNRVIRHPILQSSSELRQFLANNDLVRNIYFDF